MKNSTMATLGIDSHQVSFPYRFVIAMAPTMGNGIRMNFQFDNDFPFAYPLKWLIRLVCHHHIVSCRFLHLPPIQLASLAPYCPLLGFETICYVCVISGNGTSRRAKKYS